ncbi:efflux RND transporter periplasmic adaptor subunit [Alterinioella nitratireducens]|jgi:RND family efflux transporter MFP subunit|uniref:efflux RND transporter periplasmic adaptor subunit n=1 Tax=Alterinioella nitratireducens TaxID=2735915 RepID=UPI0015569D23|nr:efflux RND transporter periplasmic adaptor subunit [Alterinioella nitratireducens]NPD19705.1 efflux RND transporter periplasmic adaptor subunit [Alterinioella nitratireducens]
MFKPLLLSIFLATPALSQTAPVLEVTTTMIADRKAVFATVESVDTLTARTRIGGTIAELMVDEGDSVAAGEVLALVVNDQMAPQIASASSQADALEAELVQAREDLARAEDLFERGIVAQTRLDQAQTAVAVLEGRLAAANQARDVLVQQEREGAVLAPAAGRVLDVRSPQGSVMLPGEPVAIIASDRYLLRLNLPERHARSISEGDEIEVAGAALGADVAPTGVIVQVYPRIENGRVIADAEVDGLGSFFVGERVRVHVTVERRETIILPRAYISTRFGNDFVTVETEEGRHDIVVLLGAETPQGVEILTGLSVGDRVVRP